MITSKKRCRAVGQQNASLLTITGSDHRRRGRDCDPSARSEHGGRDQRAARRHVADNSLHHLPELAASATSSRQRLKLSDLQTIMARGPRHHLDAVPLGGVSRLVRHGHNTGTLIALAGNRDSAYDNLPRLRPAYRVKTTSMPRAQRSRHLRRTYRLFPEGGDPTGESIYAGPNRYVIVGVLAEPRAGLLNATFGGDVAIPWTTYLRQYIRGDRIFAARFIVEDADRPCPQPRPP